MHNNICFNFKFKILIRMENYEPNIENKTKKNNKPITITTNINPSNYVFVNKTNQIASLYLKMSQKIQTKKKQIKKEKIKSATNLINSDDSSQYDLINNSLKLSNYSNFSMIKNLKTNNISGFNTNRAMNFEPKLERKQDYPIHVNLNRNQNNSNLSSLTNYIISTRRNNGKEKKIRYDSNNKSTNSAKANSLNSISCLSSRNKIFPKEEKKLDLKRIKNNKKTKKFKFVFEERKNNKNLSTTFCSMKVNKILQKSENKNTKNKIGVDINYEKANQHWRYHTMVIEEKQINEILKKPKNNKSNSLKQNKLLYNNKKINKTINHSVVSLKETDNKNKNKKLNGTKSINEIDLNGHIKNSLSSNRNDISDKYSKLLTKEKDKNLIKKNDKKTNTYRNYILNNKKEANDVINRKFKINKKELFKEIKNQYDKEKIIDNKKQPKKAQINKIKEKKKEFSKIIDMDENQIKNNKNVNNFKQKINNKILKINSNENFNKTNKENLTTKNKNFMSINIDKINSFKHKKSINNNSNIIKSLNIILDKNFLSGFSTNANEKKPSTNSHNLNTSCFSFMNQKKSNQKKPVIKITSNNNKNISYNRNNCEREISNTSINNFNNSEIILNKPKDLLKDNNLIIKKKSIGNNSFLINKKLRNFSSRTCNKDIEIKNLLFDEGNLEDLPTNYDEKFDNLYNVIHKIDFGSVLIGAESIFSYRSKKYKEFKYNYELLFIKKYNKKNAEDSKDKYLKKMNNSCTAQTDFSSSNKNIYKHNQNNSFITNEFQIF